MPKKGSSEAQSRAQVRRYVAKLPPATRKRFKELADIIHKAARGGNDVISYGVPAVRLNGRILVWYAGWRNHLAMYPLSATDREIAADKGFKTSKGTVQFPLDDPLPVSLVKRLVKSRICALKAAKA
ncbi:MAG TPA: DUF1801 domain-containing protein [Gemmatimonadaceae bacterium]|nr:DUF1801 domain-containing protein [Gemmatimonadaceae bacterium]